MQTLVHAWLALMIDISIKSLLLAAIAGLGQFLFRIRDTNLRHRVWTAALFGMLVMPALVYVIPSIPLPDWMTVALLNDLEQPVAAEQPAAGRPIAISPVSATDAAPPPHVTDFPASELPNSAIDRRQPLPPNERQLLTQANAPKTSAISVSKPAGPPTKIAGRAADRWPLVLASLYSAVAAVLIVRLLVGLALARRLIAQAREITIPACPSLTRRASNDLETRRVSEESLETRSVSEGRARLLESGHVHVPATLGFLRPVVLLPADWRNWSESKLRAVLAHELAHVRRADWLVITLADLNRAIYWFHPLAWFLRQRLSELAERNCDDAVLEAEEDRTQYARHLLEVASSLATAGSRYRQPVSGVAMARKPNVETRIDAILDAGRPLARRLGALGAITLLAVGAIAVLVTAAVRTSAEDAPKKPDAEMKMKKRETPRSGKPDHAPDKLESVAESKQQTVKGRVLGPDGKPVAGATVYVEWTLSGSEPPFEKTEDKTAAQTQTDEKGNFDLKFSRESPTPNRSTFGWKIVAFAEGFGPSWQRDVQVTKNASTNSVVSLALTKDESIRGRFIDLEGNPLAGIQVRIQAMHSASNEQAVLDWIQDTRKKPPPRSLEDYLGTMSGQYSASWRNAPFAGTFPTRPDDGFLGRGSLALPADAVSDRNGRIEFHNIGADRLAVLEIEGPSIAKSRMHVVTRDMKPVSAQPLETTGIRAGTYYGRNFQFVAEPTQPIVGVVKDADTNQPLANLLVNVEHIAGSLYPQQDFLAIRTDAEGRYRILGAPRRGGHTAKVNPAPDQPYFPTKKKLEAASGIDSIACNFALHRGRWIIGKVTDRQSEAPIKGAMVEYLPLRSNPNAQNYPNYDPNIVGHYAPSRSYFTSADGSFRVLAIPGKGILAAIAPQQDRYTYMSLDKSSVSKQLVQEDGNLTTYHPWSVTGYHALREVEIPESNETTKCELELTRSLSQTVKVVDTQGQPVTGVQVQGCVFPPMIENPASDSTVEIISLRPNEKREVVFIHPERKIGKAITISTGEQASVVLEPCAIARGRVVNEEGQPLQDLPIHVSMDGPDNWYRGLLDARTGDDGRFEVLLPSGATYQITVLIVEPKELSFMVECRARTGAVFELGDLTNNVELRADQTEKVIVKGSETAKPKADAPKSDKPALPESSAIKRSTIHGRITGADGKPAAGVDVAVISRREEFGDRRDLEATGVVLAQTKTDADGRYQVEFTGVSSKTHRAANVVARASGAALAWRKLNLDAGDVEASFDLKPEQPISGRLVDIEGQPAAGVRFQATWVQARAVKERLPSDSVVLYASYDPQHFPEASLQPIVTDHEGRFVIHGIPNGHGIGLQVEGNDRFAPQDININTGMAEQRDKRDAGYHSLVKNFEPGEEAVLPLAPVQLFTGTVRYEDTGEPVPHARLTVLAAQQKYGGMISVAGNADENGRYKISPNPGIRFGVWAYPPEGSPYLVGRIDQIPWEDGSRSKVVDVALPRGVLIKGKVLEQGSNAAVAGAIAQYLPAAANRSTKLLWGLADIHRADNRGQFEIAVPPGLGHLLVRAPNDDFVLRETSDGDLTRGRPGGERKYAHGIERVDPAPNSAPVQVAFHLERGAMVHGELVDRQGAPVEKVAMLSRLNVDPHSLTCNTFPVELTGSRFQISGLSPERDYPVHFLDRKRCLGASLTVRAGMPSPRVVLEPCGAAKMRFVDEDGNPAAKYEPWVGLIVTPGGQEFDRARDSGTPTADFVFIANVDHVNHPQPEKADNNGRLTLSALIPGATYHIVININAGRVQSKEFKAIPNETIDLGDIAVGRRDSSPAPRKPDVPAERKSTDMNRTIIHGQITGIDGKPAAGVDVAVIARRNAIGRGGDLGSDAAILAEAKTDPEGGYKLELTGVSSKTHQAANLIARATGSALAWRKLNLDAGDVEASFDLKPEQSISGRLVDIEGQPAAGVRMLVGSVMSHAAAGGVAFDSIGWYFGFEDRHLPAAWPPLVESDREGRFTIVGVPKDHGVWVDVAGDVRFAPQSLTLNTGMSEQRGERDATYRPQVVKNLKPGEEAVLPLAPAKIFTGTVRYEDTGEPAPYARLTIWASQQKFGSMISVAGRADEKGHYKISPKPGIRFGGAAYPPDDTPYLVRQLEPIPWEGAERTKTVDVTLPRGVLVRGQVLEESANSAIVGAAVQYVPEEANNPNKSDKILTGWQDIHLTDNQGRFQIVVLPGPGRLLVHGAKNEFVVQEVSGRELDGGKPGWERVYVHGIERINPASKSAPLDVTIHLKRAATVRGELVDEQGAPIDLAMMVSRLTTHPYWLEWRGSSVEVRGGRFEISGLAPDKDYPICFLDSKRRLGATIIVHAGIEPPRVVLQPCGAARMRFVDGKGKAVANFEPTVQFVMTPGEFRYSEAAMKSNAIKADADFISNVDRANHSRPEKSDDDGQLTIAALIPGATYQVVTYRKGSFVLAKEFQAVAKETIDLGDIVVERRD